MWRLRRNHPRLDDVTQEAADGSGSDAEPTGSAPSAASGKTVGDPLPPNWQRPSERMQRLAANVAALGVAWRNLPRPVRVVVYLLIAAASEHFGLPEQVLKEIFHALPTN